FLSSASGLPFPTVQWQVSTDVTTFNNIPGATANALTFTANAGQAGNSYRAVFTNAYGSVTSNAVVLTVFSLPVITVQPQDQSVPAGQSATFTTAASSSPASTVQWQFSTDGTTFSNIS